MITNTTITHYSLILIIFPFKFLNIDRSLFKDYDKCNFTYLLFIM